MAHLLARRVLSGSLTGPAGRLVAERRSALSVASIFVVVDETFRAEPRPQRLSLIDRTASDPRGRVGP